MFSLFLNFKCYYLLHFNSYCKIGYVFFFYERSVNAVNYDQLFNYFIYNWSLQIETLVCSFSDEEVYIWNEFYVFRYLPFAGLIFLKLWIFNSTLKWISSSREGLWTTWSSCNGWRDTATPSTVVWLWSEFSIFWLYFRLRYKFYSDLTIFQIHVARSISYNPLERRELCKGGKEMGKKMVPQQTSSKSTTVLRTSSSHNNRKNDAHPPHSSQKVQKFVSSESPEVYDAKVDPYISVNLQLIFEFNIQLVFTEMS